MLTREQNELRQQAQQLAQQMQSGQPSSNGQSGGRSSPSQEESKRLREISEDMRNAASGLRQQDSQQAAQKSVTPKEAHLERRLPDRGH